MGCYKLAVYVGLSPVCCMPLHIVETIPVTWVMTHQPGESSAGT